jgi:predicted anti-sigma-YlaC factor YlaD
MNCERELEVVTALMDGRWPDGCEPALHAHAAACPTCGELVQIAGAVREQHLATMQEAVVPPSGLVWWRAQRRSRQEALATASRAITTVQAASVGIAIVTALTVIGFTRETWQGWVARASDYIAFGGLQFTPAVDVLLLVGVATAVLLAPIVVWFAVTRD